MLAANRRPRASDGRPYVHIPPATVDPPAAADRLHRDALVVDAASFFCTRYDDALAASGVTAVSVMAPWPSDDFDRALRRAEAYHRLVREEPRLRLVERVDDVAAAKREGQVGLLLCTQNARLIEDRLERLETMRRVGFRTVQLTYNERNFIGDGCAEPTDAGLSRFGREVVRALAEAGLVMDLTHAGHRTAVEALALAGAPAIVSHANPRALYDNPRNVHDDVIRAVADTGGAIGCTLPSPFNWPGGDAPPPTLANFVRAVEHVIDLVGDDHVAIGSDIVVTAGAYPAELSAQLRSDLYLVSGAYYGRYGLDPKLRKVDGLASYDAWPRVTAALLEAGHDEARVRKIVGGNLLRVYGAVWG
jgi:membrane dipeptidase